MVFFLLQSEFDVPFKVKAGQVGEYLCNALTSPLKIDKINANTLLNTRDGYSSVSKTQAVVGLNPWGPVYRLRRKHLLSECIIIIITIKT